MNDNLGICIMCVKPATAKWTVGGRGKVAVAALCDTHGDMLEAFTRTATDKASNSLTAQVTPRPKLRPLTGWKPPKRRDVASA